MIYAFPRHAVMSSLLFLQQLIIASYHWMCNFSVYTTAQGAAAAADDDDDDDELN